MSGNSGFIFYNEPNLGAADRGGSLQLLDTCYGYLDFLDVYAY